MAKTTFRSGAVATVTVTTTTQYIAPVGCHAAAGIGPTEADFDIIMEHAGTFSHFTAHNTSGANTATHKLRKNGADGNQSAVVSGTQDQDTDLVNTDTVSVNDTISTSASTNSGTCANGFVSAIFEASGATVAYYGSGRTNNNYSVASTTWYEGICIDIQENASLTEADLEGRVRAAGTWEELQLEVVTNTRSTTTTIKTRVNGADGNQSIAVSGSSTGTFQDSANTDTVSSGDDINYTVTTGTGTGLFTMSHIVSAIVSDSDQWDVFGNALVVGSTAGTYHSNIYGRSAVTTASSQHTSFYPLFACTATRFRGKITANSFSGDIDVALDINNVNGNNGFTISSTSTGDFEDTTSSDILTATDRLQIETTIPSGTGSITVRGAGLTLEEIAAPDFTGGQDPYMPPAKRSATPGGETRVLGPDLQCIRPTADNQLDGWRDQSGGTTDIYQSIDDDPRDDSDYIKSPDIPSNAEYLWQLGTFSSPPAMPFTVDYAYRSVEDVGDPTMSLVVTLYEGASPIKANTHSNIAPGAVVHDRIELSQAEFDSIGDFGNLFIGYKANQT